MTAPLLSIELALRIELAETQAAVGGAETMRRLRPERGAAVEPIAGGFAIYCGPIRRPRRPWVWDSMGRSARRSSSGWRISIAAVVSRCAWRPVRWRMLRCSVISERLAVCLAQPGSSSQRNIVRRGFTVLYTRVKFEKELESGNIAK
jgi:hypothetical protein